MALKFVKEQTEEICLGAVKQNGRTLKYVEPEFKEACERYLRGEWLGFKICE